MSIFSFIFKSRHDRTPMERFYMFLVVMFIAALIFLFTDASQKLDCIPDVGCTVTTRENHFTKEHIEVQFNPRDIASYKILKHHRTSGTKYHRKHYYVYSLYLEMKNGSNINLKHITFSDEQKLREIINEMWYNKEVHY